MKFKYLRQTYFLWLLVLSTISFHPYLHGQKSEDRIQAGTARINITPTTPIRMSGYGARKDPSQGIHDSLFARAVVFAGAHQTVVVIGVDVIGFSHDFVDETKEMIQEETGILSDRILMSAAHNHGGPVTSVYWGNAGKNELMYYNWLKQQITEAVKIAKEDLQPVKIGCGGGICHMNINRRAAHAEGGVWLGRNPAGPCDRTVGVVRIDKINGDPLAVMVNWPCHATTGGQENYLITADWPGAAAGFIEQEINDINVLITAGASADINPVYGPNKNFNDIKAIGDVLGNEVKRIYSQLETYPLTQMEIINKEIVARGKKPSPSRMPNVTLMEAPDQVIRVSVLKIGPIIFAGVSGELMTEIGMDIKNDSPYKHTYLITHCNGSNGYLCTDKAYEEGGYEPMVSRTMPGTADKIRSTFREMINGL